MTKVYPSITNDNKSVYDICHFSKQKKNPYNVSTSHATSKFSLLHFYIWGPISTPLIHGHGYFLTIVDDYSRFTWMSIEKISTHFECWKSIFISIQTSKILLVI